jgi:hypothetical protein
MMTVVVGVVAVVAVSAMAAGSASAAEWHVGGSPLTGSAELASSTGVLENVNLELNGGPGIECTGKVSVISASITASDGGKIEHLRFTGCSFYPVNSGCVLSGTTVETKPLTVEAALGAKSPEDTFLLKPVTGKVFLTYTLTGSGCEERGENNFKGKATFIMPKGREGFVEQELVFKTAAFDELESEFLGNVTLKGKIKVKLASGETWSFR